MNVKTHYKAENSPITGMSDDELYGREPALGVDLDACRSAALREVRRGLDHVVMQSTAVGSAMIRRAVLRLSVALGNQSRAEEYIWTQDMPRLVNISSAQELADREQLDCAVAREHPHPGLLAALKSIQTRLAEMA